MVYQMASTSIGDTLMEYYLKLYDHYGPQGWWPGDGPLETIVGAILTQFTSWLNVERALDNLKSAGAMSVEALRDIPTDELALLIRPSGAFNQKARRLKAFVDRLWDVHDGNLDAMLSQEPEALRQELLSVHGIGPETADDIMLYAAEQPYFVIDSYTRRVLERWGVHPDKPAYDAYQRIFHDNLPRDARLYNEYHALFDRHAKELCKTRPACAQCFLKETCPAGWRNHTGRPHKVK